MSPIVAFSPMEKQPPVPCRARADRLRALPQFTVIVGWLASALLHVRGQGSQVLEFENVAPTLRDQISEETVRALAALDPIAESVARHQARRRAAVEIARMLAEATDVELQDPSYLQDRGNVLADYILGVYRQQLVYGPVPTPERSN